MNKFKSICIKWHLVWINRCGSYKRDGRALFYIPPLSLSLFFFFPFLYVLQSGEHEKLEKDCFSERHEKVWQRNLYMSAREMRRWERERCCAFLGQAKWRSSLKMNEDGWESGMFLLAVSMSRKGNIRLPWCSIILEEEELLGADAFIQYIMFFRYLYSVSLDFWLAFYFDIIYINSCGESREKKKKKNYVYVE